MHVLKYPAARLLCVLAVFLGFHVAGETQAAARAQHELQVTIEPAARALFGTDRIHLEGVGNTVRIAIAPGATIRDVLWDGRPTAFSRERGLLSVQVPGNTSSGTLSFSYRTVFDDEFEVEPLSLDNPGMGVRGTIFERGAFLLQGSGWYPRVMAPEETFALTVRAPKGLYAVTAGKLLKFGEEGGRSLSRWEAHNPVKGLSLSLGPYQVRESKTQGVSVYTFFYPDSLALSPRYLEAAASHVQFYANLHGPYAFSKFAVVENFFPTGYGFPSYTLLGSAVIRLPFIPETSLRHEVAHCWWGNGVLVDSAKGNWSEGLTTYVADHMVKELESAAAAREYRLQVLRDFALLAADRDLPLAGFGGRVDPATRAIGYGKGMFLFHMARQRVGDEPFWESLRQVYESHLFKRASWDDFAAAFSGRSGWSEREVEQFFEQWVLRAGAPKLVLADVETEKNGQSWLVKGNIVQSDPFYRLQVPMTLHSEEGAQHHMVDVHKASTPFSLRSAALPVRLTLDPDAHLFRLLHGAEIPPTVNTIKGADEFVAVLCGKWQDKGRRLLEDLLIGLNQQGAIIRSERDLQPDDLAGKSVLFFGVPQSASLRKMIPDLPNVRIASGNFHFESNPARAGDCLFLVAERESGSDALGLVLPAAGTDSDVLARTLRKITHYGKYSYLLFRKAEIREKGVWEVDNTPVDIAFQED
ncbi:MAG: M1 family metallopeptidase [Desulfovibrionales bacterium]